MEKRKEWQEKKPMETEDTKLCRKWCIDSIPAARSLESGHQYVLNIVSRPGALDNMPKSKKIHFSQKIEFEDLYKKGIVKNLWDYYQTKDERLGFWRNLEGEKYKRHMEKIYNGEISYF